jgi:hypothetical protein
MALAPGGRLMAYGGTGNDVQLVELLTKKESNKLTGLASPPLKLSFSGDGNTLAALASDGATVRIWDLARNATRRQLNHNRGAAGAFALSPDGKVLATTALAGKMLVLWDVGTRELTHKGPPLKFTTDELGALWTDLANTDFEKADAAWQKIAAAGDNAVPFLHKQIQPIAMPVVDMKHIDKLVADLDADKFAIRDRATKELIGVGEMAIVPLQRLLEKRPSQEAVTRANLVLKKLSEPVLTPERLRVLEAIELLEALQTPKAVNLLQEIERGALIAQLRTEARRALQRIEAANEDKK